MNEKFKMTMNLNVLRHLGINLYSNIPAVLSEIVANAWDADAQNVYVNIHNDKIIITDDGNGMDINDINNKYLTVGYQKRDNDLCATPKFQRPVMGRKGIGKLSLFSIAEKIEIHTCKNGQKNGFLISTKKLEEKIKHSESIYYPDEIPVENVQIKHDGTKIILTEIKKKTHTTAKFLKKRIARRFTIIGAKHNFNVHVNGELITVTDRDYFQKLKDLWVYSENEDYASYCKEGKLQHYEMRQNTIKIDDKEYKISGWIGAVEFAGELKDEDNENLNKLSIMVRGKLAQEDILEDFSEGGLYSKYLIGEITADFLDDDDKPDIATSSRQKIIEDDERYIKLKEFIQIELKYIQKKWQELRDKEGKNAAFSIPAIKNWFRQLGKDHKPKAETLFGKINQLPLNPNEKKDLFKHSVLAFESFRYKENLEAFDKISAEDIGVLTQVISNFDDIEATLYHQIVTERLRVVKILHDKVDDNALEKVLQQHLYEHLWLLDPSWDRATETPIMEKSMKQAFLDIDAGFSEEEKRARCDIRYKKTSGKHIIIELKRASVTLSTYTLLPQVNKYYDAIRKVLAATGKPFEPIEIVCLVGKPLSDWTDEHAINRSIRQLAESNARVILYKQLIEDSYRSYLAFLEKNEDAGRVSRLIQEIEKSSMYEEISVDTVQPTGTEL